ncbi:TPA: plasmid mobilization relaxosome protein MobC [Campylobacter fetus subsp. venerealis]|nr:plasmid mobilization relaxosome protein MobC [Campylobacter fetus subsp. venerealis]
MIKSIRFNKDEWQELEKILQENNISFSKFTKSAIFSLKVKPPKSNLTRDFLIELSRAGNNLNQIARHLNTSKKGMDRVGLDMLNKIEQHLKELRKNHDC